MMSRGSFHRVAVCARTPKVVLWVRTRAAHRSATAASARIVRTVPGRDFFMLTGERKTSRAPASNRRSMRGSKNCGFMSSMVASRTVTWSRSKSPGASPIMRRSRLGCSLQIAASGAVGHPVHGHGRHGPVGCRQRGEDRGPGRGGEFRLDLAAVGGDAGEEGGRAGGRHRHLPVGGLDEPSAEVDGRDVDALKAEVTDPPGGADHVGHGIQGPHLVEVDAIGRGAVGRRLGIGQAPEDAPGVGADRIRDVGPIQDRFDVRQVTMRVALFIRPHEDAGPHEGAAHHPLGTEVDARDAEAGDGGLQFFHLQAGVHEGAEDHVAAGAAETVEVADAHV